MERWASKIRGGLVSGDEERQSKKVFSDDETFGGLGRGGGDDNQE